jgi:antagonist of KipI
MTNGDPTPGKLTVLAPGLATLVVDRGRPRSRSLGVPVGGAADRLAFVVGNALVGNPPDAAALEIALAGPTLRAGCDLAGVVYGAPFALHSDRQPLTVGKTFTLTAGEELVVAGTAEGARAYLCVRGGLQTSVVLRSRSGLDPLAAGAELPCLPGVIHARFLRHRFTCREEPNLLRVLDGPQADWFRAEELFGQEFAVAPASNRMGLRLRGHALALPERELVSEPVCPGSVQVTRDGQCIVLGVDGQTIGGYPKIAQVIQADLDKLAQLRPDAPVRFRRVDLDEAEVLYHRRQAEVREWVTRLRTAEVFAS